MKRFASAFLSLLLFCGLAVSPALADEYVQVNTVIFYDVPETHWAYNYIQYFAQQGIINGKGDGTFAPDEGVTRESFAKMMVLTFHASLKSPETPSFTDVAPSRWSYPYVEVAKDFLTGYVSPFDGSMSYHPEQMATREDIAVALVRMLGLTGDNAKDPNYAARKFSDADQITPSLLPYVSLAAERGLINGKPVGYELRFDPTASITRAEVLAMLDRASKQAVADGTADLKAEASVVYSDDGKTAYIYVTAEEGASVEIDGEALTMEPSTDLGSARKYVGVAVYVFEEEGSETFHIQVKKLGRTKSLEVTAKYEVGAPRLSITQCPTSVDRKEVTIRGTLKDSSYGVSLTINGKPVNVNYYGDWEKSFTLTEGDNTFTIVGTNEAGKSVTETRTINFTVGGPRLAVTQCPTSVTDKEVTIRGTLKDSNYGVSLTINGKPVNVNYYGDWEKTFTLTEGDNTFTIVGTNEVGKTVTETRTINFTVGGPRLAVTQCPTDVTDKEVTIRGTLKDSNYGVSLTINGKPVNVNYYGDWEKSFTLTEGDNTFTIVGTNEVGKTVTETRTISFTVSGPKLAITRCPASVTDKEVTIRGTLKDSNYGVSLTINGKPVNVNYYGDWEKTFTLTEGDNTFTIVGTNEVGKTVTETRTVTFTASAPEFTFYNCPETTTSQTITIEGQVSDAHGGVRLYLNDQALSVSSYGGSFSKNVTLTAGENTFTFRAVNSVGKETTVVKTVLYQPSSADVEE